MEIRNEVFRRLFRLKDIPLYYAFIKGMSWIGTYDMGIVNYVYILFLSSYQNHSYYYYLVCHYFHIILFRCMCFRLLGLPSLEELTTFLDRVSSQQHDHALINGKSSSSRVESTTSLPVEHKEFREMSKDFNILVGKQV